MYYPKSVFTYPYFDFYKYKEVKYISTFPKEWTNHDKGTGPIDCSLCCKYGKINECFIGYCISCSEYYKKRRGEGILNYEKNISNPPEYLSERQKHIYKIITEEYIKKVIEEYIKKVNLYNSKLEINLPIIINNIENSVLNKIPDEPPNDYDWTSNL